MSFITTSHTPSNLFTKQIKFLQKAVIFHPDEKGKFLSLKRPQNAKSRPGAWDLPGGNVQFGEEHETALVREVQEESGLIMGNIEPHIVLTNFDAQGGIYYLFIGYSGWCSDGAEVKLSSEHTEYKWVTKKQFMDLQSADFLRHLVEAVFSEDSST